MKSKNYLSFAARTTGRRTFFALLFLLSNNDLLFSGIVTNTVTDAFTPSSRGIVKPLGQNLGRGNGLLIRGEMRNHKALFLAKGFGGGGGGSKGGGFGAGAKKGKQATKKKQDSQSTIKKKRQLKERVVREYGGDIAKGTEARIQKGMDELSPELRGITELYQKVSKWEYYQSSMTEKQLANVPQRDIDGGIRARAELDSLYEQHGVSETDMHNIFQRVTWDASADAKAMTASIGQMPAHIEQRVTIACEIAQETMSGRDGRCLDVGCGHGSIIPALIKAGMTPPQIVGVDLSPEMIRNAQERHRGVKFLAADFIEFADDDGFDSVIFCSALHDLPDMKASLVKATSLLRDGGKIVIIHAQGAAHVAGQNKANPVLIKRLLPEEEELLELSTELSLELERVPHPIGSQGDIDEGYLAVLKKK